MTRIWKKIIILFSVLSLLTYTLIPEKKAEASVIGSVTTLGALAASMPALAPVAIVGVACVLLLGLTITNFDEIVELGQRVADSMTQKGYRIEDYVNDIAYTIIFNAALKQSIQEIAGNVPDYVPYIENRSDELVTIPIDYSKVTYPSNRDFGAWPAFLFTFNGNEGITFTKNQQMALSITFDTPVTEYKKTVYDFGDGDIYIDENISIMPGTYYDRADDWIEVSSTARLQSTPILNSVGHLVGYDVVIVPRTWGDELAHIDGILAYSHSTTFRTGAQPITGLAEYPATAISIDKSKVLSPSAVGTLTDALFPGTSTITINKDITLTGKNIHSLDDITDYEKTAATTSAISQAGILAPTASGTDSDTGGGLFDLSGIMGILQAILAAILGLGQSIVDGILAGFSWLQTLLTNIWQGILSIPGATAIASAIGNTFSWLQGAIASLIESVLGLPILIASAMTVAFHWAQELLNEIWQAILTIPGAAAIASAIGSAFSWLEGHLITLIDNVKALPNQIATGMGLTFDWLKDSLNTIWGAVVAIPGAIGDVLTDTFSWLQGLLNNVWQTAIAIPGQMYDVLVDVFNLLFTLDQDWLQYQLQILVAELALKIPELPNVVDMVAYKGDQEDWAGLYANFDHYGIGRQKVVDNHAPNYFRNTTKIIIRGFLYFLLALFFIRKVYIFADD